MLKPCLEKCTRFHKPFRRRKAIQGSPCCK